MEMRDRTRERTRKDTSGDGVPRALVALLAAGLACVALAATASAREGGEPHRFTATKTAEVTVLSSEQELSFDALTIRCKGVKATKTHVKTVFPALAITVQLYFIKCTTDPFKIGSKLLAPSKAMFGGPVDIEYRAGGEPNATILNTNEVPIAFHNAMEGCALTLTPPAPSAPHTTDQVTYTNAEVKAKNTKYFPSGVQHVVTIGNSFSKITYKIAVVPAKRSSGPKARKANTSPRCRRR